MRAFLNLQDFIIRREIRRILKKHSFRIFINFKSRKSFLLSEPKLAIPRHSEFLRVPQRSRRAFRSSFSATDFRLWEVSIFLWFSQVVPAQTFLHRLLWMAWLQFFKCLKKIESSDFWEAMTSWKMLERNCSSWSKNARKTTEKRKRRTSKIFNKK